MQGWMGRAALELIGQGGLGCSLDPIAENAPPTVLGDSVKDLVFVQSLYFDSFSTYVILSHTSSQWTGIHSTLSTLHDVSYPTLATSDLQRSGGVFWT